MLSLLLLAWWPFAHCYTSVGFEFEQRIENGIAGVYWRVRWPSDGSIIFARIERETEDASRVPDAFDFGAAFLKPAQACGGETFWQQLGFWLLSVDVREDRIPGMIKDADRAWVIGMPHGLLVLVCSSSWWLLRRQRRAKTLA